MTITLQYRVRTHPDGSVVWIGRNYPVNNANIRAAQKHSNLVIERQLNDGSWARETTLWKTDGSKFGRYWPGTEVEVDTSVWKKESCPERAQHNVAVERVARNIAINYAVNPDMLMVGPLRSTMTQWEWDQWNRNRVVEGDGPEVERAVWEFNREEADMVLRGEPIERKVFHFDSDGKVGNSTTEPDASPDVEPEDEGLLRLGPEIIEEGKIAFREDTVPPALLAFHRDGKHVGKLDVNENGQLYFSGDAEASALELFNLVMGLMQPALDRARGEATDAERKRCAKIARIHLLMSYPPQSYTAWNIAQEIEEPGDEQ